MGSIDDNAGRRTDRFEEEAILPALREAFSARHDWRGFSPHQLAVLSFLYGYTVVPAEDHDVEAALPFALEDWEGVA